MAREYSTHELHAKLFQGSERFYLIDTLPRDSYQHRHIPGALSLPLEELVTRAGEVLPEREAEIVSYCASPR